MDTAIKTEVIVSVETLSLAKIFVLCAAVFITFFALKKLNR